MSMELSQESDTVHMLKRLRETRARLHPCRPPLWAPEGHSQTLLGHFLPSLPFYEPGEKFVIQLESDHESLVATYLKGETRTIVHLFHGLGGSIHAPYMQRTARIARSLGHHVLLSNHRGCGDGVGLAVEPYHSGSAEDLSAVIAYARRKFPGHRHLAIGFSLSANALLLLSAGVRANVLPDASIAVNAAIDLEKASVLSSQGLCLLYGPSFVSVLRESVRQREGTGRLKQTYKIPWHTTIRGFDEIYTAPASGFESREHYYRTCSSMYHLSKIKIPTVLMTAADDPLVEISDYQNAKLPEHAVLHIEEHGGHMGYLSKDRSLIGSHRWLDYALRGYLTALG